MVTDEMLNAAVKESDDAGMLNLREAYLAMRALDPMLQQLQIVAKLKHGTCMVVRDAATHKELSIGAVGGTGDGCSTLTLLQPRAPEFTGCAHVWEPVTGPANQPVQIRCVKCHTPGGSVNGAPLRNVSFTDIFIDRLRSLFITVEDVVPILRGTTSAAATMAATKLTRALDEAKKVDAFRTIPKETRRFWPLELSPDAMAIRLRKSAEVLYEVSKRHPRSHFWEGDPSMFAEDLRDMATQIIAGSTSDGRTAERIGTDLGMIDDISFDAAFVKARASGLRVFTWRGSDYTTRTAEDNTPSIMRYTPIWRLLTAARTLVNSDSLIGVHELALKSRINDVQSALASFPDKSTSAIGTEVNRWLRSHEAEDCRDTVRDLRTICLLPDGESLVACVKEMRHKILTKVFPLVEKRSCACVFDHTNTNVVSPCVVHKLWCDDQQRDIDQACKVLDMLEPPDINHSKETVAARIGWLNKYRLHQLETEQSAVRALKRRLEAVADLVKE